jgi:hypothetical protein
MKFISYVVMVGLVGFMEKDAVAQGTTAFQNLDFENGVFVPAPTNQNPFAVDWVLAMPGWTGLIGTNQQTVVSHNALSLSVANITIQGPDYPSAGLFHGQYYVVLQGGLDPKTGQGSVGSAIAQTGTIPSGTQSIRLLSNNPFALNYILTFGGNIISMANVGTAANGRTIWGGDVSAFASQTGELRFQGAGYLDYIQFSTQQIPEPSAFCLVGLGALLFSYRARLMRRS